MTQTELKFSLATTRAFIAADEDSITPFRPSRSRVPGGGTRATDPVATSSRLVRMIPGGAEELLTPAGAVVRIAYVVLAMPGTDIQVGDTFLFQGTWYQVMTVDDLEFEMKAKVISRG